MIPIYKPYFTKEILSYAHDALDSTWVSSNGKYLQLAEELLSSMLGIKHVILTNNGTTACHLMARGLAKHMLDTHDQAYTELIVPNNCYVAAWNAFLYDNKFRLNPIDANINTWNIDLEELRQVLNYELLHERDPLTFKKNRAVLIVHNLGSIINVPELKRLYPTTTFVEDCCEGLFGTYEGIQAGTASVLSSISFYGNKNVTSGEGGAVLTNEDDLNEYLLTLRGQGQSKTKFIHNELGYNYRMTNVAAALLYGQLLHKDEIVEKKGWVFTGYDLCFRSMDYVEIQGKQEDTIYSNWMYGIRITHPNSLYDKAEKFFADAGIEIRPMFYPMSYHKHLSSMVKIGKESVASLINKQAIILPSYPEVTNEEIEYIRDKVKEYIDVL